MTVLSDRDIRWRVEHEKMIDPFEPFPVREMEVEVQADQKWDKTVDSERHYRKVISYGVSSYGYDCRLGHQFKVFTNLHSRWIDPKNFDESCFEEINIEPSKYSTVTIPPNSFALGVSLERFKIPRDIMTICVGKSTYARSGIIVSVTPLEPEWEGYITVEISNTAPLPCVVYPGEGILQVIFLCNSIGRDDMGALWLGGGSGYGSMCEKSYADKQGKYQNQPKEVVPPRV
jgi:dCTP deaminase